MKGASLDGKTRKPTSSANVPQTPKRPSRNTDHLRPASPPKLNPWARLAPGPVKRNKEFPSLSTTAEQDEDVEEESAKGDVDEKGTIEPVQTSAGDDSRDNANQELSGSDGGLEPAPGQEPTDSNTKDDKDKDKTISDEKASIPVADTKPATPALQNGELHKDKGQEKKEEVESEAYASRKQASFSSESIQSPTTLSCTSEHTSDVKGSPYQGKDLMSDTISDCSSESRKLTVAAAATPTKFLFYYGVGSDVEIHAETLVYSVHRQLLVESSGWFRRYLPSPNQDGSIARIYVPFAAGAVGPCLSYIYTNRIDVCKRETRSIDASHLTRCVLGYCAAMTLRMSRLSSYLLRIVQATMVDFAQYLATHSIDQTHWQALILQLFGALKIIHGEPCYDLVRPMRLALAGVLDSILPSLIRQESLFYMLALPCWKEYGPSISADIMEYRTFANPVQSRREKPPISEDDIEALFDGVWPDDVPDDTALATSCETLRPGRNLNDAKNTQDLHGQGYPNQEEQWSQ